MFSHLEDEGVNRAGTKEKEIWNFPSTFPYRSLQHPKMTFAARY